MVDGSGEGGRSDERTHRFQYDGEGSITSTIVLAIADLDGVDSAEMEPLYSAVDPGLLDAIEQADGSVSADVMFTYRGYRVTFDSDDNIVISPSAARDTS